MAISIFDYFLVMKSKHIILYSLYTFVLSTFCRMFSGKQQSCINKQIIANLTTLMLGSLSTAELAFEMFSRAWLSDLHIFNTFCWTSTVKCPNSLRVWHKNIITGEGEHRRLGVSSLQMITWGSEIFAPSILFTRDLYSALRYTAWFFFFFLTSSISN